MAHATPRFTPGKQSFGPSPPLTKKGTATPRCAPTCGTAARHQPPLHSNVYVYKISV